MANIATIVSGKLWEGTRTWPTSNKVFNVYGFDWPERRHSVAEQAPSQRTVGYPRIAQQYGMPQLTWFEGTYDLYANKGSYVDKCEYPNLLGPFKSDGTRDCLDPGKLTDAERRALAEKKKREEDAIAKSVETQKALDKTPKKSCTTTYIGSDGKKYVGQRLSVGGKEYVVYRTVSSDGSEKYYDCKTDKLVFQVKNSVRGLGETDIEKVAMSEQQRTHRTIEIAMLGAIAVGLYLIWKV